MKRPMITRQMRNCAVAFILLLLFHSGISVADQEPADAGFRDLIENSIVPILQQDTGYELGEESWEEIRSIMERNGRKMPERSISAPSHSKDGVLRMLFSTEFGGTLGEWRVEDQAWYADITVALGLCDSSELRIPQDGEITQEQAVQIAKDYLHSKIDADMILEDRTKYQCTVQYVADSTWRARWYIEFSTQDPLDNTLFQIQISPCGEVDEVNSYLSEYQAEDADLNPSEENEDCQN